MKFRKQKKGDILLQDPVVLQYPSGAPIICGADKIYSVAAALTVALRVLEGYNKHSPKLARSLVPVSDIWFDLAAELAPFVDLVEEKNKGEL